MSQLSLLPLRPTPAPAARCLDLAARCGLPLTPDQIRDLDGRRLIALRDNGLVELDGGVLPQLIARFGPRLDEPGSAAEDLAALQAIFYHHRRATAGALTDGELLDALVLLYDGPAHGAIEPLADADRYDLVRIGHTGSLRGTEWEEGDGDAD